MRFLYWPTLDLKEPYWFYLKQVFKIHQSHFQASLLPFLRLTSNLISLISLSLLQYGHFVWPSTYPTNLKRQTTLQKIVFIIISHAPYGAHTVSFFKQNHILPFSRITRLQTALFMHKYHKNPHPPSYDQLFTTGKNILPYETRNAEKYWSHSCQTNHNLFSILFQGPKIWNSLPNNIREKNKSNILQNDLKNVLLHDLE